MHGRHHTLLQDVDLDSSGLHADVQHYLHIQLLRTRRLGNQKDKQGRKIRWLLPMQNSIPRFRELGMPKWQWQCLADVQR